MPDHAEDMRDTPVDHGLRHQIADRRLTFGRFAHRDIDAIVALLDELRPRSDGKSYSEQITYVTDRPGHDRRYAIDASKIEHELGWRPAETFATGIRKTVNWYLDHPEWVANVLSGAYRDWVEKNYADRR